MVKGHLPIWSDLSIVLNLTEIYFPLVVTVTTFWITQWEGSDLSLFIEQALHTRYTKGWSLAWLRYWPTTSIGTNWLIPTDTTGLYLVPTFGFCVKPGFLSVWLPLQLPRPRQSRPVDKSLFEKRGQPSWTTVPWTTTATATTTTTSPSQAFIE